MKICADFLHCSHSEFLSLSKVERTKWMVYEEMVRRREIYFNKKHKAEMEAITNKGKV